MSSLANDPSARKGLMVLSEQASTQVAFTNVDYLCAGNNGTILENYLRSPLSRDEALPDDEVRLFDYVVANGSDPCGFDPATGASFPHNTCIGCHWLNADVCLTGAYVCEDLLIGLQLPTSPLPDRCSWDDGYTDPPVPIFHDVLGTMCNNVVLDVYYNFTWKGQEIVQLNATVILGENSRSSPTINFSWCLTPLFHAGNIDIQEDYFFPMDLDEGEVPDNRTYLTQVCMRFARTVLLSQMLMFLQRTKVEFFHDINYTVTWDAIEDDNNDNPEVEPVTLPYSRAKYDRSGKQGK